MHWKFDRLARIEHIVERTLMATEYFRRSIRDTPKDSAARGQFARRLVIMEDRLAWFRSVARASRHNARREALELASA